MILIIIVLIPQKLYLEDEDGDEMNHVIRQRTNRKASAAADNSGTTNQKAALNGAVSSTNKLSEEKNGVRRSTRQRRRLEQAVG